MPRKIPQISLQLCITLVLCFLMAWFLLFGMSTSKQSSLYLNDMKNAIVNNFRDYDMSSENCCKRHIYSKHICPQERLIWTSKGEISYAEIDAKVFRPFGYRIMINCNPIPILERITPITCKSVFNDWLEVANSYDFSQPPPQKLSIDLLTKFLLNNYSTISYGYRNDREATEQYAEHWTKTALNERLENATDKDIAAMGFYKEALSVSLATKKYSIRDKIGLVIGSQRPWVELFCVRNGAKKVFTAEYRKIPVDHERFGYVHPIDLAKNWETYSNYDFIVSFSSIEHSGLGRYGDPIDPIGDLREMQKIYCQLKKGGLVFIGFPVGQDSILFNLNRYYGTMRLALMFTDFILIDVFDGSNPYGISLVPEMLKGTADNQYLFVLEKI